MTSKRILATAVMVVLLAACEDKGAKLEEDVLGDGVEQQDSAPQDTSTPDLSAEDIGLDTTAMDVFREDLTDTAVSDTGSDTSTPELPFGSCRFDWDCPGCDLCEVALDGEGVCVPSLSTCATDADCGSGAFCQPTSFDKPGCGTFCAPEGAHPECSRRGGQCELLNDPSETCPAQTYEPYTGFKRDCPTGAIRICCVPTGEVGAPCDDDSACPISGCLAETSGYPPGGMCTRSCDPLSSPCPTWAQCMPVEFAAAPGVCMVRCQSNDDCRAGWSCEAFPEDPFASGGGHTYVCWASGALAGLGGACTDDASCISRRCLTDPGDGAKKCSALCSGGPACTDGFACNIALDACFPTP